MSTRRMRPARPAEQHKGYYGNAVVKEDTGGLQTTPASMKPAVASPCVECPLRRDSAPGFLGGYSPEMYREVLFSPASIACHSSKGFHEGDIASQHHCTGVAAFRANVGWVASMTADDHPGIPPGVVLPTHAHDSTTLIGHDEEHFFATYEEFAAHHKDAQVRTKK